MEILEHYIKEIHSEEEIRSYPPPKIMKVDVTTNCWGQIKRWTTTFTKEQWEIAKYKGYFLA